MIGLPSYARWTVRKRRGSGWRQKRRTCAAASIGWQSE
jgi:hypothetical protein